MRNATSRRQVLKATAAAGVLAGSAGCLDSVPLLGSSGPCSDLESFFNAQVDGDAEAAVEYIPYEYMQGVDREMVMGMFQQEGDADLDVSMSCSSEEELDDDEIEALETDSLEDGHEITAAYEVTFDYSISGESMGQSIDEEDEGTDRMVEIDGDGWYVWI